VQFLLQFEPPAAATAVEAKPAAPQPHEGEPPAATAEDGSKIVSLDQFRKK
jgi:hypothetical protein